MYQVPSHPHCSSGGLPGAWVGPWPGLTSTPPTQTPWHYRFVRGTCKKTDGTCPFSHHVSKEKVSVGSFPQTWDHPTHYCMLPT